MAKPSKELPEDLEEFMQNSGEHGVVLLAFGSAVCNMDQVIVERILTAISRMKQKFIWKMKCKFTCMFLFSPISICLNTSTTKDIQEQLSAFLFCISAYIQNVVTRLKQR